jgi:hypothetical protein
MDIRWTFEQTGTKFKLTNNNNNNNNNNNIQRNYSINKTNSGRRTEKKILKPNSQSYLGKHHGN